MKKFKYLFLAILAVILVGCDANIPTKKYVGTWEPVGYEGCDVFVITTDSIKAIQCTSKEEHYQSHYKMLRKDVAELERCWLENHDYSGSDFNPEQFFFAEVKMYIDKEGHLIIKPFDYLGGEYDMSNGVRYPDYGTLKLRKYATKQ